MDHVPIHPLGIKPAGNGIAAAHDARSCSGHFRALPDQVLVRVLEALDAALLCRLGRTCRALYAFCTSDELWRALFIHGQPRPAGFAWRGSWRRTYLDMSREKQASISCHQLYSDVLHRPFQCAHISLAPYASGIPRGNAIARLDDLSAAEFGELWADRPFILTQGAREWPASRDWSIDALLRRHGTTLFRAESVDWPLATYVDYMRNTSDESPLYLFDPSFVEKMRLTVGRGRPGASYWAPDCFGEDLFGVLGEERPDSRWLIIGPERSGSTFHKDPNATSAWNAVLRGSKYWIMFPARANAPPPGVFVSADEGEVTSPLSIAEWLLAFHAEARRTPGCLEGVCAEGEVLHVPSGWWHLVVNLEPSIAVTQNFVPRAHLAAVLAFLKDKPDQVSGFPKEVGDAHALFVDRMKGRHPEWLRAPNAKSTGRKRRWEAAVGGGGSFAFGFGGAD
jgi:hypothetical protein